jgi:hypothetical protein
MVSLLSRDQAALAFIGRGDAVAQYQLRVAIFPGLSEVVSSRRVRRWITDGLVTVERFQGFGINRLRLTDAGRDAVVAAGAAPEHELFVPTKGVALKDLSHHLWINDLRVVALEGLPIAAEHIAPAWLLQRQLRPTSSAIPDLLLTRRGAPGKRGRLLALEVDMGGERIVATFLPKLRLLADVLTGWAGAELQPVVLVLTRGPKRLESLRAALAGAALPVPVAAELLPSATGEDALSCLRTLLRPRVSSSTQEASSEVTQSATVA